MKGPTASTANYGTSLASLDSTSSTIAVSCCANRPQPSRRWRLAYRCLRGAVYDLYLRQAQGDWNAQPSYVFDEWGAYTNGLEARICLSIPDRMETGHYALEFIAYAMCVPWAAQSRDRQMKAYLQWQTERVVALCRISGIQSPTLARLRAAPDAQALRDFARPYFGAAWTRRVLGF